MDPPLHHQRRQLDHHHNKFQVPLPSSPITPPSDTVMFILAPLTPIPSRSTLPTLVSLSLAVIQLYYSEPILVGRSSLPLPLFPSLKLAPFHSFSEVWSGYLSLHSHFETRGGILQPIYPTTPSFSPVLPRCVYVFISNLSATDLLYSSLPRHISHPAFFSMLSSPCCSGLIALSPLLLRPSIPLLPLS